jgi:hypothetical protein
MSKPQTFWPVECEAGEPDLLVCMSCLSEVYKRKVPMPDCPTCHGVSTYEAFTLEAIRDWGTEQLIEQAARAHAEADQPVPSATASRVELSAE